MRAGAMLARRYSLNALRHLLRHSDWSGTWFRSRGRKSLAAVRWAPSGSHTWRIGRRSREYSIDETIIPTLPVWLTRVLLRCRKPPSKALHQAAVRRLRTPGKADFEAHVSISSQTAPRETASHAVRRKLICCANSRFGVNRVRIDRSWKS